ncbi:DUF1624 domain-containing protein [Chloroflexota bacterium]
MGITDKNISKNQGNLKTRLAAVDALRGLIIVLMALDHANHFIAQQHSTGEYWGGPFPSYQEALPFLTRFVTHFCAPGFFLLMGMGMVLFAASRREKDWSEWRITAHFLVRGLILMALQLLLVNRAWELSPSGWVLETYIGVLFALGLAMIVASLLLRLKPFVLIPLSLALLVGTELLVPDPSTWGQALPLLENLLLVAGGDQALWVNYPALAWLELVILGMVFGRWLVNNRQTAYKRAVILGAVFLGGFIIIRALDGFGNLRPRAADGWMDFLNPVKYPPSISFTLLTTGLNLIALGLFDWGLARYRQLKQVFRPLVIIGGAPLFFYVSHLFLYAALARLAPPGGVRLAIMYIYWLLGVALLLPFCDLYRRLKRAQPAGSPLHYF